MRLHVVHETHYSYSSPVALSQQLLHLSPRKLPWQECQAHRLSIEPQPGELREGTDYFGNRISHMLLAQPHSSLLVRAASTVRVEPRERAALALPQTPWEEVRDRLRAGTGGDLAEPGAFLFESPHVETFGELSRYAAESFSPRRPTLEAALDFSHRVHRDFEFDPGATDVSTSLREVMQRGRGVCQDFAHLMIGGLRGLGIPARYVSGYLLTDPPPGRPRLIGADASHAWLSVYCGPAAGWIDLDPTNDCVVDDEHVTLGWGREFGDVTPLRGVVLGGGEQILTVRVTVSPAGEPSPAHAGSDAA